MPHMLFDLLENSGVIRANNVALDVISSARRSTLIDIAKQSAELTEPKTLSGPNRSFAHTAPPSLSGAPHPCANIDCRVEKATQLIQFAALYSDTVYINNGLYTNVGNRDLLDEERRAFANEVRLLLLYRPLIEAGIVVPVTPSTQICLHCLGREAMPESDRDRFDQSLGVLCKRFEDETLVTIVQEGRGQYSLRVEGTEALIEHGSGWMSLPDHVRIAPSLVKRLRDKSRLPLSRTTRRAWKLDAISAHTLFNEIGFEMAVSSCLNTSIVTNEPIHIDILKNLRKDHETDRRNALIQKHLTCMVPFLDGIGASELLALRKTEEDAFISFRKALAAAVDEHMKARAGRISENDAEMIYQDIVRPELARLNRKVISAKKMNDRKSGAGVVGWAAAISVGLYFGIVESSLAAAAKALGLTKVLADLTSSAVSVPHDASIRDESMYFLWKVQDRSRTSLEI